MTKDTEKKQRFELVEYPTQLGTAIRDNNNPEALFDERKAIVEILNIITEIKSKLD